jgi:alkylation response protein AidB-like acyl-CoA dehydrogenase
LTPLANSRASELAPLDRAGDRDESSICQALPQLAEMGFLALRISEEHGGLGLGRLPYTALLHEMAYASPSAAVTISVHNMVAELADKMGSEHVLSEIVPLLGSAEHLGALAISEADAGSDAAACATIATPDGDGWRLNGNKMWITNGISARWFVTLVQTGRPRDKSTLAMLLVDGESEGLERIKIHGKMGLRASETVSLHFTDLYCPGTHLLAPPGGGLRQALFALNGGRVAIAAQATGVAEACMNELVRYAKQRHQFERPIASFPAIQNMIADSQVDLAAAKQLIAYACWLDSDDPSLIGAAARAKLFATESADRIADRAVQVHGGAGYVNDSLVEQLYRDIRVTRIYEGTSEVQRTIIARELKMMGVLT